MGRRSQARRLNLATRQEREEEFDVEEWLLKPKQKATREEVYALLRQYHWEHGRARLRSRGKAARFLYAVWLVLTWPIRASWGWLSRKVAARQRRSDRELAQELKARLQELEIDAGDHFGRNSEEGDDGA